MKLFIGGEMGPWPPELYREIEEQSLSIHHSTEGPLEKFLADKDYGLGLQDLYLIPMVFRPDVRLYDERQLYRPKKGEADYRLKIDYDTFIRADEFGKRKLIIQNLIQSIKLIKQKTDRYKVEFNAEKMEKDIRDFLDFYENVPDYIPEEKK